MKSGTVDKGTQKDRFDVNESVQERGTEGWERATGDGNGGNRRQDVSIFFSADLLC